MWTLTLDPVKWRVKLKRKYAFEQEKQEPGLKFNAPG